MKRNTVYTTGQLLDYKYFLKLYILIAIDLILGSRLILLVGLIETMEIMFFIIEKPEEKTSEFLQNAVTIV